MGAWPYCRKPTEWDMEEAAKRNISASPMDPSKKNIWPKKNAVPPIETERRPDTGYLPRARYSPGQGFTSALPTTTLVPWGVLLPVPAYSFEVRKGSRLREALVFEDEEPPAPTDEEMVDLCTKLAAEILDETELKRSSIEIGDKNSMSIPQVEFSDENIPAKSSIVWDPGYIERTTEILANKDAHAEASSTINARFQH